MLPRCRWSLMARWKSSQNTKIETEQKTATQQQLLSAQVEECTNGSNSDNDWTENWFFRGNHTYERLSPPVCSSGSCDFDVVVTVLNIFGVHPNQSAAFIPGKGYSGDVNIPGPFGVDGVKTTAIYDKHGLQIGVGNETLLGHALHPGVVQRSIVEVGGSFHIYTEGGGFGYLGGPNVWLDDLVWGPVDQRVIDQFR
jgi:hypothetical protein